jgi:hypothetical protein
MLSGSLRIAGITPQVQQQTDSGAQYAVTATFDSGAGVAVAPKWAFPDYPVIPTTASETGVFYAAANGALVADEGEVEPIFQTSLGIGPANSSRYSIADVHKVLTSAARVCNNGFRAVLDAWDCDSYLEEKATGDRIPLRQEQGVYVYDMFVYPYENVHPQLSSLHSQVASSSAQPRRDQGGVPGENLFSRQGPPDTP